MTGLAAALLAAGAEAADALLPLLAQDTVALAPLVQAGDALAPLAAEPPIGGAVWTVVIPAILLVGSFLATFLLYRRFAREED